MVACDGRVTPTGGAHKEVTSWREERGRVGVVVRERVMVRECGGDGEGEWR